MFNFNLRKMLIAFAAIIIIGPPVGLYIQHKLSPPALLYELSYTEVLTDEDKKINPVPVKLNFCFEVPIDLNLKGDLQDFMIAVTKKDIGQIVMADITDIKDFTYQTREGCGDYTAMIAKEDTRTAYELFRNGEIK